MNNFRPTGQHLTEKVNPRSKDIDNMSISEIVDLMAGEDLEVIKAVSKEKQNIAKCIELVINCLNSGGRLFFVGAGTSGRLGVLEAAECPPTFGSDPCKIQAIIAGGKDAVWNSVEGAEDSESDSKNTLKEKNLSKFDMVIGVAASSSTPFVTGAIDYAKEAGSVTGLITCSPPEVTADAVILLLVGPEVIVGSTRLKSGTATKMVLNMITTASMVKMGKTYGNLMVDVQPKSSKLKDRAIRIVCEICEVDSDEAVQLLKNSGWSVKIAVIMKIKNISREGAEKLLNENKGLLRKALI